MFCLFCLSVSFTNVLLAHEVKMDGHEELWYGFDESKERKYPPVITVFSAPNYCDMYKNKSSILVFNRDTGYEYKDMMWGNNERRKCLLCSNICVF